MNVKAQTYLWLAQRASAAVLALCVVVHLATMIYAIRGGLSAGEILSRTRGNGGWLAFYSVFVLMVAVHAPIGLDIGAETPGELAVCIVGEIIRVLRKPGSGALPGI